ncbi:MAG TPA: DMT family transporter [Firmicutes bacterium]|nr:DMT family transporter [Bacillota bacterium]
MLANNKAQVLKRAKPYLAGIGSSAIFGFSFMFTKGALDKLDVWRLIGFRFLLASIVISLLMATRLVKVDLALIPGRSRGKDWRPLLWVALLQPIAYFIFETFGVSLTTSSQAGMLIALIPIFVIILSTVFLGERPSLQQAGFIVLSVAGVIFIAWQQSSTAGAASWLGLALIMGAVITAALFNIGSRRASAQFAPVEVTCVMMWVGAIIFNLLALFFHWRAGNLATFFAPLADPQVIMALLYLGIGSSVVAFFLVNYGLSQLPASQAAVFSNLTTVVSIVAGVVFRNEPFYWFHALGAAAILVGVWGANYFGLESKVGKQRSSLR